MAEDNDKKTMNRRAFFQTCAIGTITGTASLLFYRAWKSGEDCIGDRKCGVCFAIKKCELPLAKDFRNKYGVPENKQERPNG